MMKKLSLVYFLIMGIILITGCINNQPELIIKTDDVPGFTLNNYILISMDKERAFDFNIEIVSKRVIWPELGQESYKDKLKSNKRNVEEISRWNNEFEQFLYIRLIKFDSNEGFEEYFESVKTMPRIGIEDFGFPQIGDNSYYATYILEGNEITNIKYTYKNYFIDLETDANGKNGTLEEAKKIAVIVKNKLDQLGIESVNDSEKLIGGPVSAVRKRADYVIEVVQGEFDRDDLAKKIYRTMTEKYGDQKLIQVIAPVDKIAGFLPPGGSRVKG